MPSKDLLDELLRQVLTAKKDATLKIELSKNHEIRRYKDEIYIVQKNKNKHKNYELIWHGESEMVLPNGSKLTFKKVKNKGIDLKFLQDKKLLISNRKGGESFKADSKRPTKKLKQFLQESDLPPWERESLPLVFIDQDLVCIPLLGVHEAYQVKGKKLGLVISRVATSLS
jgi:tRNA(Ile)-lysidine synthase